MPLGGSDRWLGEGWDRELQEGGLLQWEHNPSLSLLPGTDSFPISPKPPTQLPKLGIRPSYLTPLPCPFFLRPFPKASCSSPMLLPQPPSLLYVRAAAAPLGWLPCLPLTSPSHGCQMVLFNTKARSHHCTTLKPVRGLCHLNARPLWSISVLCPTHPLYSR